ncbi:hypothetical protein [Oceanobacillus sp. CF4.6]|uniref:hypothetical protein n=1 Tax=Oceanobacillus sp. CF4.6 TaxID=3373080 RepID=UPI003EE6CCEC
MDKEKRKSKMGWFGWTMVSVVTVTIIASGLFFFNVFQLDLETVFDGEDTSDAIDENDITDKGKEELEKVRSTVGQENTKVGQFVSTTHEFYNKTTGYGGINNLDWEEQKDQSQQVINSIEELTPEITDERLLADLESIRSLAQSTLEEENSKDVRNLHRYFHDLDIALNDYTSYDRMWKVTESLKNIE